MKKTILVTGSNGLLGQKLTELYLSQADIQLVATGKGPDRFVGGEGYAYESLDVTSKAEVEQVLNKWRPDVVIHTAAMTNVDQCESDRTGCDALNVDAVKYIVECCNAIGAHLVHVSTDFIFDGTHGPLSEEEVPAPLSYYGQSKLKGEQIVMQQATSWCILRTVLVYGVVGNMSRGNVVLWAKENLEKGKSINVVDDQFRTPTLAEDLASGCMLAAEKKATGIYHISGKDFMSIYELVEQVADFWNLDKSLISRAKSADIKQPAQRPPVTGFIIGKAIRELGYKPHSFAEGLQLVAQQLTTHV